jgi:O-antigen/teichoic acid export membrane protein
VTRSGRAPDGILSAFTSLLAAQTVGAVLGLVFWVTVARLIAPAEVGVAAAAISAQTLLGSVTALGVGTMLISELPLLDPADQRRVMVRGIGTVALFSAVVAAAVAVALRFGPGALGVAMSSASAAVTFVVGTAAAAVALVVDQGGLGMRRSRVQVGRNLLASALRFPIVAALVGLGHRDAGVLQVSWVLPLLLSLGYSWWRLGLGRPRRVARPRLRDDVRRFASLSLRNHALSLTLAAGSQLVPVVAALVLPAEDNAAFAVAWLLATFVFLPPYLLATALFAHGANQGSEEFRGTMASTVPAALLLSLTLCVGAWLLGEPVLRIFGSHYAGNSAQILSLLVGAGLWFVLKDHLVAFWRSQRRYRRGLALTGAGLVIEIAGCAAGGLVGRAAGDHAATGLCLGWLAGIAVEVLVFAPRLREAFGGLRWTSPLRLARGR